MLFGPGDEVRATLELPVELHVVAVPHVADRDVVQLRPRAGRVRVQVGVRIDRPNLRALRDQGGVELVADELPRDPTHVRNVVEL